MTPAERLVMERIAAAILNARAARRGVPAITNVLVLVDPRIRDDALDDAQAVMKVLAAGIREPLA